MPVEVSVSVVVTTYKRLDRLDICLTAILSQTISACEIIVIHDGPDENFSNFMREKFEDQIDDGRIIALNTTKWAGRPAPARNLALKVSRGRYIAFCDDDDIWMPQKLEVQFKYMEENVAVDALFSDYSPYFEGEVLKFAGSISPRHHKTIVSESVLLPEILKGYGLCLSSSFIKKQSLVNFNFKETLYIKAFEDYALWLDLLVKNKSLVVLKEPLLYYLMNNKKSIRKGRIGHNLRLSSYIFLTLVCNGMFFSALISPFLRLNYLITKLLSFR
jgi:teichuronic acid biosynthesis glycosyltransferase TuaG